MTDADFPALGFDPAPGSVPAVAEMVSTLSKAVTALQHGGDLLHDLSSSTSADWEGDAADKFRGSLSGDLPKAMSHAHDSLQKAQTALDSWQHELTSYQQQAKSLEAEAETAKADAASAAATARSSAAAAPPPGTEGPFTPDVQTKITQANNDNAAATAAAQRYQAIIERANTLSRHYVGDCDTVARALHDAPDHLAPHKPGFWDSIGNFFTHLPWKKIGDALAAVSAIAGVAAIFLPPPLNAIALAVSVVASIGAFAAHLAGGDHSLWDLGADALGAIPGVGVLADAAKGAELASDVGRGVEAIKGATSVSEAVSGARTIAEAGVNTVKEIPNAVRSAASSLKDGSYLANGLTHNLAALPGVTDNLPHYAKWVDAGVGGVASVASTANFAGDFIDHSEGVQTAIDDTGHLPLPYIGVGNLTDAARALRG